MDFEGKKSLETRIEVLESQVYDLKKVRERSEQLRESESCKDCCSWKYINAGCWTMIIGSALIGISSCIPVKDCPACSCLK